MLCNSYLYFFAHISPSHSLTTVLPYNYSPPSSSQFQCPQQPNLHLAPSRINDGTCDCCDGADEPLDTCPDQCTEILAAERAARAKAEADFVTGSQKRSEEMAEFGKMLRETVAEIEKLTKSELPTMESEVGELDNAVRDGKMRYMTGRFDAVKTIVDSVADIGRVATMEEIHTFIVTACHFAGELMDVLGHDRSRNKSTCLPLRLAGLDLGFIWEDENLDKTYSATLRRLEEKSSILSEVADLMIKNAESQDGAVTFGKDDNVVATSSHRQGHRNHPPPDYGDDDYHYHHDDDEYPHEGDEDEEGDSGDAEEEEGTNDNDNTADVDAGSDSSDGRKEAVMKTISLTRLATSRSLFLAQARSLKDKVDAIIKESESDGDEDGEGGDNQAETETDTEAEEQPPAFDPQAVQMTRAALDRRLKHVEKGEMFATSATVLLDALEQTSPDTLKQDMINLAVMTIYHSQLSAGDVADLFYLTMMGADETDPSASAEEETCSSMYSALCPPTTETRSGVSLPPKTLFDAAKARCEDRVSAAPSGCPGDSSEIPNSIADGFSGYFVPQHYAENDPLGDLFQPLSTVSSLVSQVSNLEAAKKDRDSELSKVRGKITDLEDKIGGRDEPKYGADGELYGIRDSCHIVESGKYEYEVCIFKKATQRDSGQKGGGTHLGNWVGMSRDEETGQRVMKWDKGTKCWNGPNRSATVYVTCGAETKLLTADEPSTCEYVFTMESHIACDEAFKRDHGL